MICCGGSMRHAASTRFAASGSLTDAIAADLDRMENIAPLADIRLDTSGTKAVRSSPVTAWPARDCRGIPDQLRLLSFSYRRRIPDHSDMVIDMRFAENPHWVAELRRRTGVMTRLRAF
jgi:UPF0042 nucleotide-binding protein